MRLTIQQAIDLGIRHQQAGMVEQAVQIYRQVLQHDSNHPDALNLLGVLRLAAGDLREAFDLLTRAIAAAPQVAEFHNNLGVVLQTLGRHADAEQRFRAAVQLKPDYAAAMNNLAAVIGEHGQLQEAISLLRRAVAAVPEYADAHNNLGNALMRQGRMDEAIESYRRTLAIRPDMPAARSNFLLGTNYLPRFSPREIYQEHATWGKRYVELLGPQPPAPARDPDPNRRLRIGYVSGDFRQHSVAYFILPILANHDRNKVEVFSYSDVPQPDALTQAAQKSSDAWRPILGMTDESVAGIIRSDRIDVLIDLMGHTSGNRTGVFARKPAPVQVTYLGYPNTSGLPTMDCRVTDSWVDPPGEADEMNVERLVRIDPCAWCFQPEASAPPVGSLAADSAGGVTFGSFNALAKINGQVIAAWCEILRRVPGSRLLIKSGALVEAASRERVTGSFARNGAGPERLEVIGHVKEVSHHLGTYNRVDIALDTFPYNGTTTTCEAMWMGVPVIALAGTSHAGRVGVSLLTNVGLADLVARDVAAYIEIAATLAHDRSRLRELRADLRQTMTKSPLCDGRAIARRLESAYRGMWLRWCESAATGRPPAPS